MGLLDFLKKSHRASSAVSNESKEVPKNVFKGDLAIIKDASIEHDSDSIGIVSSKTEDPAKSINSPDSIVFMSFASAPKGTWTCPECGTRNKERFNGCVVCGLRK